MSGRYSAWDPGSLLFREEGRCGAVVHVHVCEAGHFEIEEMLSLRDYLRSHWQEAERYGNLKSKLSDEFTNDNVSYMRGKDGLVKELVKKSLQWRKTTRDHNDGTWQFVLGNR